MAVEQRQRNTLCRSDSVAAMESPDSCRHPVAAKSSKHMLPSWSPGGCFTGYGRFGLVPSGPAQPED
uniref:Uncharacterized protein n=1 Tax=Trichuris muris TaxID=70415 RepID=A0A5S6QSK5_TRIMR